MSYFHCLVFGGAAVAIKVEEIDPVTPIPEATFVTGNITNTLFLGQSVTLWAYDGTPANGSTDGVMFPVNDTDSSSVGELQLFPGTEDSVGGLFSAITPVVTTNATVTDIGFAIPIPDQYKILVEAWFSAFRDTGSMYTQNSIYMFSRNDPGGLQRDGAFQILETNPPLTPDVDISGNNIQATVKGLAGQNWTWSLLRYTLQAVKLS